MSSTTPQCNGACSIERPQKKGLKEYWGHLTWMYLHVWSCQCNINVDDVIRVITTLCERYPCKQCRDQLIRLWDCMNKGNGFDNAPELMMVLHNEVNKRLEKTLRFLTAEGCFDKQNYMSTYKKDLIDDINLYLPSECLIPNEMVKCRQWYNTLKTICAGECI